MKRTYRPELGLAVAQRAFQTVAVAVSGLYIATHSVAVTMIGTTAATAIAGWASWLLGQRREPGAQATAVGHEEAAIELGDVPSRQDAA
jgi:hypothetical protein